MLRVNTSAPIQSAIAAWLMAWLLLTASASALAQPRTLYKPEDIENARQNMERYAWAQAIVTRWERSVGFALEQDREFFVNLIFFTINIKNINC